MTLNNATKQMPKPVLQDHALYLCDNGACYCGAHAGTSARYTGHDLSGMPVERITAIHEVYAQRVLRMRFECETCRARKEARS